MHKLKDVHDIFKVLQ